MIARLIISENKQKILEEIQKSLSELGISNPHPDLYYFDSSEKLGIEQARKIKQFFSTKPYSADGKVVVLEDASKLTDEAQNSLLKTLEELTPNSLFILGANSDVTFLPTVLSRCKIIKLTGEKKEEGSEIEKIINLDISSKFEYIEKCKDRKKLLFELTAYFRKDITHSAQFLKKLIQAEEWANSNVNIRAILEYLVLVCPIRK